MTDVSLDDDEFIDVKKIPFDRMVKKIMNGEIEDGKTINGILGAKEYLHLTT